MENCGIVLSIPVAFVLSTGYCLLLAKIVARQPLARSLVHAGGLVWLGLFALEVTLLVTLGAVRSRALLGPAFYVVHMLIFFLGTPALGSALVLSNRGGFLRKWYVAAVACTVFALILVLLQYDVSERLYGIDGDNGPFSQVEPLQEQSPHISVSDVSPNSSLQRTTPR